MTDLFLAAIDLAAQPVALVGYLVLGVWARSIVQAVAWAVGWALAMQLFVMLTGGGFADPAALVIQFALRAAGAVVLTLAIWLLDRTVRGGGRGSSGPRTGGPSRPGHLRRVK